MKSLKVELGDRGYDILIGSGLLEQSAGLLTEAFPVKKYVIITNPAVDKLYGSRLKEIMSNSGLEADLLTVPDGERYKTLDSAGKLYENLTECFAERNTPVLALGGGVIGDLAGFVAATYMRGVPLIQVPTTLLAQVDSSIGGKVAVDHGKLKNKIGTFYQPNMVITDITTLKTLPYIEFANGMAEVIKSAVIRDRDFFVFIGQNLDKIIDRDEDIIEKMVFRAAAIKALVVMQDERDTGLRNILNFGHTIGHAVETISKFKITHGQAVSIGMVAEAKIAASMGIFEKDELEALVTILTDAGLPTQFPDINIDKVLEAMKHDKKNAAGRTKFALPKNIGDFYITDQVDISTIRNAIEG
jgi:3-dehydroquinate synthase